MPSDVTGTEILQNREDGQVENLNSSKDLYLQMSYLQMKLIELPPKTQSALLEAMQEKRVTVAGRIIVYKTVFCPGNSKSD